MFYTIYKVTNKVNGKIYIGAHETKDLDDGYMGSGKVIKKALNKYGVENFEKEILELFDDSEKMYKMESKLVTTDFIEKDDNYNIVEGGRGGWGHINNNLTLEHRAFLRKTAKKTFEQFNEDRKNNPELDALYREKCGKHFKGKKHTAETKRKIGAVTSKAQKGEGNSVYGTMWIHSLTEKVSKRVDKDELSEWENKGWLKGRKMIFRSPRLCECGETIAFKNKSGLCRSCSAKRSNSLKTK